MFQKFFLDEASLVQKSNLEHIKYEVNIEETVIQKTFWNLGMILGMAPNTIKKKTQFITWSWKSQTEIEAVEVGKFSWGFVGGKS